MTLFYSIEVICNMDGTWSHEYQSSKRAKLLVVIVQGVVKPTALLKHQGTVKVLSALSTIRGHQLTCKMKLMDPGPQAKPRIFSIQPDSPWPNSLSTCHHPIPYTAQPSCWLLGLSCTPANLPTDMLACSCRQTCCRSHTASPKCNR